MFIVSRCYINNYGVVDPFLRSSCHYERLNLISITLFINGADLPTFEASELDGKHDYICADRSKGAEALPLYLKILNTQPFPPKTTISVTLIKMNNVRLISKLTICNYT